MLTTFIVTLILYFIGTSFSFFLTNKNPAITLLIGLGAMSTASGLVSGLSNLSVGISFWISFGILVCIFLFRSIHSGTLPKFHFREFIHLELLCLLVVSVFEIVRSTFGSYNFDFLYNVTDAIYLRNHSVNQYSITQAVTPLNWSADAMGRFGGSFIISGLSQVHLDALAIALALYSTCIACTFFIVRDLIILAIPMLNRAAVRIIGIFVTIAPLMLQGWHYELFGQTTGYPILLSLLILFMQKSKLDNSSQKTHFLLIFGLLLGSLYWIYPAHYLFALGFVFVTILISRRRTQLELKHLITIIGTFLVSVILPNWQHLNIPFHRLGAILDFTKNGSSGTTASALIFNQYSSHVGPLISFGLVSYPFRGSMMLEMLGYLSLLILTGLVIGHFISLRRTHRETSYFEKVFVLLIFGYLFVYLASKSNYLLFKISSWIQTLVFIAIAGFVIDYFRRNVGLKRFNLLPIIVPVTLIFLTTLTSVGSVLSGDSSFKQAKTHLSPDAVSKVSSIQSPLLIAAPSAEDVAWMNAALPTYRNLSLGILGPNLQELNTSFASSCVSTLPINKNENIAWFVKKSDIFPNPGLISNTATSDLGPELRITTKGNLVFALENGFGLFYPERSQGWPFPVNQYFRWSTGVFGFSGWSQYPSHISLEAPVAAGPDHLNSLTFHSSNGVIRVIEKSPGKFKLEWDGIALNAGWNCISAAIQNPPLFISSNNSRPDFRPLAFALGEITIKNN